MYQNKQRNMQIQIYLKQLRDYSKGEELSQLMSIFDEEQKGFLNFIQFKMMIESIIPQIKKEQTLEIWNITMKISPNKGINYQMMKQFLIKADKVDKYIQIQQTIFSNIKEEVSQKRNTKELYDLLSTVINSNKINLKDSFELFDQNQDQKLNYLEMQGFLNNLIPQISEKELTIFIEDIVGGEFDKKTLQIGLHQLMKKIQVSISRQNTQIIQKVEQVKQIEQVILQSNIYENPLLDNVNGQIFQEFIIIDEQTSGIQQFLDLMTESLVHERMYLDPNFPANSSVLGHLTPKVDEWLQTHQIWGKGQNFVFSQNNNQQRFGLGKWISPTDIKQGQLGDCYFLASVSSIACTRPDLICQLFVTQRLNAYGLYCVRINVDGEWRAITIDDRFPCTNGQPVFTSSLQQEIWVMLLEKAWAKIFRGYNNIESGEPSEVMFALTGAPTINLKTADVEFNENFDQCVKEHCILVCASYNLDAYKVKETLGLISNHAYSILKYKDIVHPVRGKTRLVKLRNPWGKMEWKGDWSDSSPLWTPELKKQINLIDQPDGVFYMDISSFIQYFSDVSVCYLRDNYKQQSVHLISDKKHSIYFQIGVRREGEYFFSVHQENKRFNNKKDYSYARIVLCDSNYQLLAYKYQKEHQLMCRAQLKEGIYYCQIKVDWEGCTENTFNLTSYGPDFLDLKQIEKISLSRIYQNIAKKNQNIKPYQGQPNIYKTYEFITKAGHGYLFIQNNSQKVFENTVNLTMKGMKLKKPHRGNQLKLMLVPGQNFLALFTMSPMGYQYQMQESFITR